MDVYKEDEKEYHFIVPSRKKETKLLTMPKKTVSDSQLQSPLKHSPFAGLKGLVDPEGLPPSKPARQEAPAVTEVAGDSRPEEQLFLEAMEGVSLLARDHAGGENMATPPPARPRAAA